ncbi:MFS transporter [Penicillium cf. griseofulvum]|uniref:MFS transporter n=1 Tax=Penicillium cf. griseofulvum TaxID=2972120 RepID=A0A9W9MSX3_9EURO|nr:MFS transporter [Penicillium cf. griseofulvum]KAJ5446394.1 MFS transporter [Penicillium cf. griseofulvum]KAJ5448135.1 MFS transporter [Penicillium cf. griseofulvum]
MAGGLIMFGATLSRITGDAFTAVAFMRNTVSIGIPITIFPWIQRNGIQTCGMISLAITGTIIPMVV